VCRWQTGTVVEIAGFQIGQVELTRIPYFDVPLDAAVAHLTADQVRAIDWATPAWASDDGQVLVGQAVWVVVSQDQLIVVDPCGTADEFLRSGPEAIGHQEAVLAAMREAGFPPERVDVVVLSHLEGIGMTAVVDPDGRWAPAFPNARVVLSTPELEFLADGGPAQGLDALNELIAQGVVDGVDDGYRLTDEVGLEVTAAHTPGHAILRIDSDGEHAVFLGHLLVSPLSVAAADGAEPVVDALIARARADDTLLVGSLWPFPGAGYVTDERAVVPAD
jgi:glyoxylase-like metal-dependent hydrolase (beta-lactamase superfamily II)